MALVTAKGLARLRLHPQILPSPSALSELQTPPRPPLTAGRLRRAVPTGPPSVGFEGGTWTAASKRTGVVAVKRGMSALWDAWGQLTPVTLLQVAQCQVVVSRFDAQCGEYRVQVGAADVPRSLSHRVARPQLAHFRRYAVPPKKVLADFRVSPDAILPSGSVLSALHFVPGQFVDCQSKSTGKGFQGPMKRWNFKGLRASHGVSLSHRSGGSTGQRQLPGKVFKGKKMAGRMGGKTCTVQNLRVMKIDTVHDIIYVKGAVPGPEHGYVKVTDALRKGWFNKTFPPGAVVPFPTFSGSKSDIARELVAPPPDAGEKDPLARARREIEK
ncbi:54S ribosomal protein L9, mitochondrial [Physocladia obscura]|uniref:Large ribosomal subunit protein uL3m n=1 Tax=Physocladia obscura TaxID=109957 RepID=A0AAD5XDX3_9FUNG|nr:54S ribosomal protein L9, mitochondrial [Physocladia obscura]